MSAQLNSIIHELIVNSTIAYEATFCDVRAEFRHDRTIAATESSLVQFEQRYLCKAHLAEHVRNAATFFVDRFLVSRHRSAEMPQRQDGVS